MIHRIGLGLAFAGAVALFVAGLLVGVPDGGWGLLVSAGVLAASAAWVSRGHPGAAMFPVAVCVMSSVPVVESAALLSTPGQGSVVQMMPLGVAGVGLVVALTGSLLLCWRPRSSTEQLPADPRGDRCPRCERPVAPDSRTCGYCGFAVKRYRARI